MAATSPSPGSAPSDVTSSFATPPQPLTPPPSSQATPIQQPNATSPNPSTSFAQSPSSNASNPTPAPPPAPPPVDTSPPPTPSAPPPSSTASPPPTPIVTVPPLSNPSAPPPSLSPSPPEVSPPPPPLPIDPPVISPPPAQAPPPLPPPSLPPGSPPPSLSTPPTSSPRPPSSSPPTPPSSNPPSNPPSPPPSFSTPLSSPPPPSSEPPENPPPPPSSRPPENPPTPPSSRPPENPPPPPSSGPSANPPPPPSSRPTENSPPPPSSNPPRTSPSPPASQAPESTPSPPAARPPHGSPPSASSGPPPVTPATPTPVSHVSPSPPSPGPQTTVPSPPILPNNSSPFDAPQTTNRAGSSGGIGSAGTAAIGVIAGVLILGLIGFVAFCIFKQKKKKFGANGGHVIPASVGSSPRSDAKLVVKTEYPASLFGGSSSDIAAEHGGFGHSRAWFTYQELFEATGGFSDQNLLGKGGFGCVYKGLLTDGRVVAVKQLKVGASQGEWQFKAEVEIISRIHHRHLVSLVGYCVLESRRLLVYDYVPNNTLHFHLHGEGSSALDWAVRFRIAAGAARGIAYLHEDCHPRIIHRDIKSSNILLDNNFEARVSDFGLAKLAMDADTHISTRVMGTFGYLAPEYATTGKLTEKSDVYSFGVVLLELITGRRPVDVSQPLGDESLVEWARPLLTYALDMGELGGLVDPLLENNYIENEIFLMIEAAAACVRHSAAKRPKMGQIVRAFDGISDSRDLSNGLRVGESQLYNSAQQSAEIRWFRRMAFGSQDISTDFFSQPTQNLRFSTQRGHNASFSSHQRSGGNLSRQQSQDAGSPVLSGQSEQGGNFSRQQSRDAQNPGFSGQSRHIVYSSAQHDFSGDISR